MQEWWWCTNWSKAQNNANSYSHVILHRSGGGDQKNGYMETQIREAWEWRASLPRQRTFWYSSFNVVGSQSPPQSAWTIRENREQLQTSSDFGSPRRYDRDCEDQDRLQPLLWTDGNCVAFRATNWLWPLHHRSEMEERKMEVHGWWKMWINPSTSWKDHSW